MEFTYQHYTLDFFGPLVFVGILIALGIAIHFASPIEKKKVRIVEIIFCIFIVVFVFSRLILPLINCGFSLLGDKDSEPIEYTGTIEETKEVSRLLFPFNKTYGAGVEVVIDGETFKCYQCITDLANVGDHVKITYLPRSRLILSIYVETGDTSSFPNE